MTVLLLTGFFIWRLIEEPIPLTLLTPYLEAVLPASPNGLQMDVQEVVLAWRREARRLVLSARGMRLRAPHGMIDATLPTVDVTLSLPALLRRRAVALSHVYVDNAHIHVRAPADGGGARPTPSQVFDALDAWLDAFERLPLFADLGAVHVVDSEVSIYSPSRAQPLRLSEVFLILGRTDTDVSGQLSLATSLAETNVQFKLNAFYERPARQLALRSEFTHLRPSALAALYPALTRLSDIAIPLTGSLYAVLNPQETWPAIDFDLQGGAGPLRLASLYREPLRIKGLAASGRLHGVDKTLQIEMATVDLPAAQHGKTRLRLQGRVSGLGHAKRIEGHVALTAFTMADVERYWPPQAGWKARRWVVRNIPKGLIYKAKAHFVLSSTTAGSPTVTLHEITGSFEYEDVEVHYLRPLTPIQQAAGAGRFSRSGFHFEATRGDLATLALSNSAVDITGLDQPDRAIRIRTDVDGPLAQALSLLHHPRLKLLSRLKQPLDADGGRVQTAFTIALPLKKPLPKEDIEVRVQGKLHDVSLPAAVLKQEVSDGQLRIDLDQHGMRLEGEAAWAAIPLSFTWRARFKPQSARHWRHQTHVVIPRVGHAGRARIGFDAPRFIEGPMAAVIDAQVAGDQRLTADIQLDLRDTSLQLPWLNWRKPPGEPARATGKFQRRANRDLALTALRLEARDATAQGEAQFDGVAFARADFPKVVFGGSDFRDVVFQRRPPGLDITIGGGFLDAAPLRQLAERPPDTPPADASPSEAAFPVRLHVPRLHRVQMAPGRFLDNVQADLAWDGVRWSAMTVSGDIPKPHYGKSSEPDAEAKTFNFHYLPNAPKKPLLSFQSNDIGAFLRALDISDNLIGGDIALRGRRNKAGAGIKTRIEAAQFTVRRAPVFAHVLAAASLHGLANLLSSDGLRFDNLEARATLYSDRVKIKRSHARGGSLGVTAQGDIAYRSGKLDVQGTIIPVYLVNGLLGQIPFLNMLVGGKGQGLVAVSYNITGPVAKPQILVNPISALTPGFLRGIFGLFKFEEGANAQTAPFHEETEELSVE